MEVRDADPDQEDDILGLGFPAGAEPPDVSLLDAESDPEDNEESSAHWDMAVDSEAVPACTKINDLTL